MTARVATFIWQTPAPTSVDEVLAAYDDGVCRLVVRRPLRGGPSVGTYRATPAKSSYDNLVRAGPGPIQFDLLHTPAADMAALMARARAVADAVIEKPEAVATFHGRKVDASEGRLSLALSVVGVGDQSVNVELEPAACALHFSNKGEEVTWFELPPLQLGFVTPESELLGGLNTRAVIAPGRWGMVLVEVAPPSVPYTSVSFQVGGWLYDGLPDDATPARFDVRTDDIDLRVLN